MRAAVTAALILAASVARADDACVRVLQDRIKTCADACLARAKAAVDPEIRDRIKGYGCVNNCTKLEMFNGHGCPYAALTGHVRP